MTAAHYTADRGLWSLVRDAIRGTTQDFTTMPIGRAVPILAIPMVLEMAMESIFAVVDILWVGPLGADPVATIGLTEALLSIIYSAAVGLGMAGTAVVARRIGEKDAEGASVAAVQVILLGAFASVVMGIAGLFAAQLLALMGASDSVIAIGTPYAVWMLAGNATVTMLYVLNAVFRGAGDPSIAMRSLGLASAVNLVLVPLLVHGIGPWPALGVTGAAIANNLGRGIGVAYVAWLLVRGDRRITVARRHWRVERAAMATMVRMSWDASVQMLIMSASWVGIMRILAQYGSVVLAGYTISIRVMVFVLLPAWGIGNAAATLVGQNLGAERPDRAERSVWVAGHYAAVFMGAAGVLFILAPAWVVGLFTDEADVLVAGAENLRILAWGFVFFAYGFVLLQAFNGAGDTRTPLWLNIVCFWAFQIPMAWILAEPIGLGPRGVYIAGAVANAALALVCGWVFRRGAWKLKRV